MTNRFGRVIDRSRELGEMINHAAPQISEHLKPQLEILFRRARLLRLAITLATLSVLLAAVLVMALFLGSFLNVEVVLAVALLFLACLISLIASLVFFLQDINLSLVALKLELGTKL